MDRFTIAVIKWTVPWAGGVGNVPYTVRSLHSKRKGMFRSNLHSGSSGMNFQRYYLFCNTKVQSCHFGQNSDCCQNAPTNNPIGIYFWFGLLCLQCRIAWPLGSQNFCSLDWNQFQINLPEKLWHGGSGSESDPRQAVLEFDSNRSPPPSLLKCLFVIGFLILEVFV